MSAATVRVARPPTHGARMSASPADDVWLARARASAKAIGCVGTLTLLPPHASTRRYARLHEATGASRVVMLLPEGQGPDEIGGVVAASASDEPFVHVQRWLEPAGVRVPRIDAVDEAHGAIWLEDVGDLDFDEWQSGLAAGRLHAYRRALEALRTWEALDVSTAPALVRTRRFDDALIRWELDHYREWRLESALGHTLSPAQRGTLDHAFDRLTRDVAALPTGVMHRDFQSHNLMVLSRGGRGAPTSGDDAEVVVLDFQDAMIGPSIYDAVALLRDSYVELTSDELSALLDEHLGARDQAPERHRAFHLQTLQRKLKDTGRFHFLDRVRGRSGFLRFLPSSIRYMKEALTNLPEYADLHAVLVELEPDFLEAR